MHCATKGRRTQILVWFIWAIACVMFVVLPEQVGVCDEREVDVPAIAGVLTHHPRDGSLFPWRMRRRWRKWARRQYCALRRAQRRARWLARLARLALAGALTLAQLMDLVTRSQLRRQLGALPVLYALLEVLRVREIINRHCPTQAEVDHGTVALLLVLNRLTLPLPLYQVADWLAQTVLVYTLGLPVTKFNDDRLARTLDALRPHCREIWQEVVQRAMVQAQIDLSLIFYDLTAFIVHGTYRNSQHVDFGFAHNTPMNKRKFKIGLNVSADGHCPADYRLWSGRTTDMATVQANMEHLQRLLQRHGCSTQKVTIIGDRANLSDQLALAFDDHQLCYLSGLRLLKKEHKALLVNVPEAQFYAHPLTDAGEPQACWGISCRVPFTHAERQVTHRGLVVLSGPLRTALRQTRAAQLRELRQALREVEAHIGQPHCRTVKMVQRRAQVKLKASAVGKFMRAEAYTDAQGQVGLRWWVDFHPLWEAMQQDGRYLLVSNDWSLSPQQMLALYRQKDGVEKQVCVAKSDLKVSPIYLHKDERIEAMLLINMLALLAYSLLERQARQGGLQLTTRRIIAQLERLSVVETLCWDGSRLLRCVPLDPEQAALLRVLAQLLAELRLPRWTYPSLPAGERLPLGLPPPTHGLTRV